MSHICIIEDNPLSAKLASKLLRNAGHQTHIATTGEDGFKYVVENNPDLLLLDLGLPDIDGQTIVPIIRQKEVGFTKPIIAFTAWPAETAARLAEAYGCDGYISKPINTRKFVSMVEAYLEAPEAPELSEASEE